MATYKDDLDILKAAEKDSNKLSLNAITELDNKGILGMYGGGSEIKTGTVQIVNNSSRILQIGYAIRGLDGVFRAQNRTYSSALGDETVLENVVFPGVIELYGSDLIFQETSSSTSVVTEETTLHVIYHEGGR